MADWHGYIEIRNGTLNRPQLESLWNWLDTNGPPTANQPAYLSHYRERLDGESRIYEALYAESDVGQAALEQALADAGFGNVDIAVSNPVYDTIPSEQLAIDLGAAPTADVYLMYFSGTGSTWEQSRKEARAYIAANNTEWDLPRAP